MLSFSLKAIVAHQVLLLKRRVNKNTNRSIPLAKKTLRLFQDYICKIILFRIIHARNQITKLFKIVSSLFFSELKACFPNYFRKTLIRILSVYLHHSSSVFLVFTFIHYQKNQASDLTLHLFWKSISITLVNSHVITFYVIIYYAMNHISLISL